MTERESVKVLEECIDLQRRKSRDYQNDKSNVKQAMHYRRGVATIHDMVAQKLLRAQSLLEAYENGDTSEPNFEGLEDTYKDAINYLSFAVSYLRGKMEGQVPLHDMLNRPLSKVHNESEWREQVIEDHFTGTLSREPLKSLLRNSSEVEDDGFITTHGLTDRKNVAIESKIKQDYIDRVYPVGEVRVPRGELNVTDPIQEKYIKEIHPKIYDVGTRMDEDMEDHRNSIRSQGL